MKTIYNKLFFYSCYVDIEQSNPQHKAYLVELVKSFIEEVEKKASLIAPTNFVLNMRLGEAAKLFKQTYR